MGEKDEARRWQRRAIQVADERLQLNPDDTRALIFGAGAHAALGEYEKAAEMASQALALDSEDPALLYNVACTFSQSGKLEDAIEVLERAANKGFGQKEWIENDPDFVPLRGTPRFEAILQAM